MWDGVGIHTPRYMCRNWSTIGENQFFPFFSWITGSELSLPCLVSELSH